MITLELHDAKPAAPGEKHGPRGPTHCANARYDYEYQVEQLLIDLVADPDGTWPGVVRVIDRAGERAWKRDGDRFVRDDRYLARETIEGHPWLQREVLAPVLPGAEPWVVREVRMVSAEASLTKDGPVVAQALLCRRRRGRGEQALALLSDLRLIA